MHALDTEIRNHPFVIGLRPDHIDAICAAAKAVNFRLDEIILREREPASNAFLIISGRVAVEAHSRSTGRDVRVDTLAAGDMLGWSWLFPPFCWHFQARAIEPVSAIRLDGSAVLVRCEEDHEFGYAIMKKMSQLLIHRLQSARRTLISLDHKEYEANVGSQAAQ